MNDRQIEAFRATVALGSVTSAAEALHVTQPAISRLLKDLEAEIGFALFERFGRGVRPSQQGHLLFEEVERSYTGFNAIRQRAELIRNGRLGRLRVAVMPAFAETFVAPAIGALLRDAPNLGVELDVLNTTAIVEGVRRQRFDLGIAAPTFDDPAVVWDVLRSAQMVAVMSPDHELAAVKRVTAAHLAAHDVIALPSDSPYHLQLQVAVSGIAHRGARITSTVRTQAAACEVIAAGCPALTVVDPCIAHRYRAVLIRKPLALELNSDLALCFSRADGPAAGKIFRRCLIAQIRKGGAALEPRRHR
jgi:DNA-binding transcriptional LysR family regulator